MSESNSMARRELPVLSHRAPALPNVGGAGPRIGLVTLGCDKNTVDSERILGGLVGAGARVSGDVDGSDVVVVNTCGFIEMAKEESIEAILEAVRMKDEGRTRAVVAMGCLVQRYKNELAAELPEVDLFLGLTEADRLIPELRARGLLEEPDEGVPTMERPLRVLSTATPHTSFLKISEGCDHGCAFCAIPLMRGKHRSTPIEALVREARELEAAGVVELNLVSQDTTWYGRDWLRTGIPSGEDAFFIGKAFAGMAGTDPRGRVVREALSGGEDVPIRGDGAGRGNGVVRDNGLVRGVDPQRGLSRYGALPALLDALIEETDVPWFRLFYMYPSGIYPELVERIATEDRILPYLDMPIQHGADAVLKRMRRPERQKTILERVHWLRAAIPDLVLRTTLIVGFPGETDEDFESMLELLEEVRFDRVGAFEYSVEEGTPAAEMPGQVPDTLKRERLEQLMDVQRAISMEKNEAWIGREIDVLIDRSADEDGPAIGRTAGQAYEVDGVVHLDGAEGVPAGRFVRARIADAFEDDLMGVVVGDD